MSKLFTARVKSTVSKKDTGEVFQRTGTESKTPKTFSKASLVNVGNVAVHSALTVATSSSKRSSKSFGLVTSSGSRSRRTQPSQAFGLHFPNENNTSFPLFKLTSSRNDLISCLERIQTSTTPFCFSHSDIHGLTSVHCDSERDKTLEESLVSAVSCRIFMSLSLISRLPGA